MKEAVRADYMALLASRMHKDKTSSCSPVAGKILKKHYLKPII
jgi:hypothetical protein